MLEAVKKRIRGASLNGLFTTKRTAKSIQHIVLISQEALKHLP